MVQWHDSHTLLRGGGKIEYLFEINLVVISNIKMYKFYDPDIPFLTIGPKKIIQNKEKFIC